MAEDFEHCQALLQQYREAIEQMVRTAAHPQSQCAALGARAQELYAWVRQLTLIGRAKYLSRLQALQKASAYSPSPGDARFQLKG